MGNALDVFRGLEPSEQTLAVTFPYGFDGTFNRLFANEIDYRTLNPAPSATLPYASIQSSTAQTIAYSNTMDLNATNGLLVKIAGTYLMTLRQPLAFSDSSPQRRIDLTLNGTAIPFAYNNAVVMAGVGIASIVLLTWMVTLAGNVVLGALAYQDSGSIISSSATNPCTLQAMKIG